MANGEMSFMDPETGVNVVHGAELAALPADERAARRRVARTRTGIGQHRLANWPVKF